MEPNFIRPAMTGYFANRDRRTPRLPAPEQAPEPFPKVSLATKARRASGAVLIALGTRLAVPPLPYGDSPNETVDATR